MSRREDKKSYFFFGGVASAMAASCTHPLDLLKVHLQTQQKKELGLLGMGRKVVSSGGVLALYNGLSASVLRQLTYSMTRFALYDSYKNRRTGLMPFYEKMIVSFSGGFIGGIVGNPADMVNVRMQNDMKLPLDKRRNYKHAVDGLIRVYKSEGMVALFSGVSMTATRAGFMSIGQIGFYDIFKHELLLRTSLQDDATTHTIASLCAAGVAIMLTQPFDVMKTRLMNAPRGTYSGLTSCGVEIFKSGPSGFYKGLIAAFIRLAPQTLLTFIFLEQLRLNFGYFSESTD